VSGDASLSYRGYLRADWQRFVQVSHRYFIPASAAVCVGVAGAVAVGRYAPLAPYVPVLLGATGVGLAVTAVAHRLGRLPADRIERTVPVAPALALARAGGPEPAAPAPIPPPVPAPVGVEVPRPTPRAPPVAAWTAGDEIWSHWVVPSGSRLPSELIGPVPETAYAPPHRGGFVAFPGAEPEYALSQGKLVAIPRGEFAPEEEARADRGFPVTDASADDLAELIPMVGLDGAESPAGDLGLTIAPARAAPVASGRAGPMRASPSPGPNVRGSGAALGPLESPPMHLPRLFERPVCASCGVAFDDAATGHPCPECDQPVCSRCRRMAVIHYGQTWCTACATENGWPEVASAA
jgi:predicted RNA-binding Zn-ribbon protein involved in translation (DUF1610 family)